MRTQHVVDGDEGDAVDDLGGGGEVARDGD